MKREAFPLDRPSVSGEPLKPDSGNSSIVLEEQCFQLLPNRGRLPKEYLPSVFALGYYLLISVEHLIGKSHWPQRFLVRFI